jgi:DNA repair photolyase
MRIGITEQGDAGLDFSWEDKIKDYPFSILITKNLCDVFIHKVKRLQNVIIHATITGWGNTKIEPNVPEPLWSYGQLIRLIISGFPVERIVGRVDPIILNPEGITRANNVIDAMVRAGIKRIRFSYIDWYKHVVQRFRDAGLDINDYRTIDHPFDWMARIRRDYPDVVFESCAEGLDTDVGCISTNDFDLFGIVPTTMNTNPQNRKFCKCLACKKELLENRKQCKHGCLYCYWK